jgi:ADP-dependent NAD(P)H-hydrate dehydratase / NAD(P)H-hydrate epimerase
MESVSLSYQKGWSQGIHQNLRRNNRMKKLVNSTQMKEIDAFAIDKVGIPSLVLMENAANQVVNAMEERISKEDIILVVCGSGNNGGDGLAVARILLNHGFQVDVYLVGERDKMTEETKKQLEIAENLDMVIWDDANEINFKSYTVLVDAIFGIGLDREVTGKHEKIIAIMNAFHGYVFAVDIPSGISADSGQVLGTAVRADVTVTFGIEKIGQLLYPGSLHTGKLIVSDIGFPPVAVESVSSNVSMYDETDLFSLPRRSAYSNKGNYGRAVIVAGSANMSGAAYLSAKAAYRTGAGLVQIVTPEENRAILQTQLPEAILTTYYTDSLAEEAEQEKIIQAVSGADAIVIGPGIGTSDAARKVLDLVLYNAKSPLILDADALTIVSELYNKFPLLRNNPCARISELAHSVPKDTILTPHLKELARLLDKDLDEIKGNLLGTAALCTADSNLTLVMKDARTVVSHHEEQYINASGNNGMATGGSGDVLTGVIAGLLAQGMVASEAAKLGVYIHGLAGDVAAKEKSEYSLMASDIIEGLTAVLK